MINGKKVLGVIGGVGPMATVDFYRKTIELTDAACDQDHIHILIDSNTQVPDRTKSILAGDKSPVACLSDSIRRLEAAGADLLVMTCNAAHFFFDELQQVSSVPFLNMIDLTALEAKRLGLSSVGLLAVDGTLYSGIYERACEKQDLTVIRPDEDGQRKVMNLIYQEIKAGRPAHPETLAGTFADMEKRGAQGFILGCTELPLVFSDSPDRRFLDPTHVLAREAILALGYPLNPTYLTEAVHE